MFAQLSIFDLPQPNLMEVDLQEALEFLQAVSKENGNCKGGVPKEELKQIDAYLPNLVQEGYCREWETGREKRYILNDQYRTWNQPADIVDKFLSFLRKEKPSFSGVLGCRTNYQVKFHDPDVSKGIWNASLEYCKTQDVSWYLKDSSKMRVFSSDYTKEDQKEIIRELLDTEPEDRVDVLNYLAEKYPAKSFMLYPSDYEKVFLCKAKDDKELKQVLDCCGGISLPVNKEAA